MMPSSPRLLPLLLLPLVAISQCPLSANAGVTKPRNYLSSCRQSEPKFQECVKTEMSNAGHYLATGVADLNIPPIEPLLIPKISLEQGTRAINYKATLTNLKLYGLSSYRVEDLFVNVGSRKLDAKITFPVLYLESDYDIKGQALVVPILGTGLFTANLTDVRADAHLKGKLVKRKGQEYLETKDSLVKLTVRTAKAHFGNLFNGDATLSRATNDFLNQNSKDIVDEVMPAIEQVTGTLLDDICNKAFRATPFDKLVPNCTGSRQLYLIIIDDDKNNNELTRHDGVLIEANEVVIKKHSEIPLLKEAPVWLKPCRRKDPKLNECIRDTFQNMFPYLAKGIPEIGTQALEPMHIEKVAISKGQGGVTLHGAFNNLVVHGPSNTTALYTRMDFKRGKLDIGLFIPLIKVEAKYDLKGNILLLPLVGVGDSKLYLKNVTTHVATRIYFPKIKEEEVMVASSMKVEFSLALMRIHLSNLFNGNQVLGRTVNTFLNENSKEVVNELKENIGESLAGVFKKIMNDAFSHIPTKLWLLED